MDTFTTAELVGIVENLKRPRSALLDRYFPNIITSDREEIKVDVIKGKRRIAPFVSPLVAGQVVERNGLRTNTFKPAYIKDKRAFDPNAPMKRVAGETIGGSLSLQERLNRHLATELEDQTQMLTRRMELMASEAIRTGKLVITGDNYPTQTVDFERDATLTPAALAGGAKWDQGTATPLRNLKAWAKLVRKASGVNPVDVIMGDDAFAEFADNAKVVSRLDNRNTTNQTLQIGQQEAEGLTFQGVVDGFNIFTYSGWYVDPADGVEKEIWPADIVGMTAPGQFGLGGERLFGAIMDPKAGYAAMPFFPKMWETDDPAATWLMMQSAPLIVPTRVDATFAIDVL